MTIATPDFVDRPARRPTLALPPLACDAHVHVFGPKARFPFAAQRPFTPDEAPKEELFALHARLGIKRCVVVQSSCHGFDNAVTEDALAAKTGAYRGVALLPSNVSTQELRRLDSVGFRGVRFNFMRHLGQSAPVSDLVALAARLAPLGWHLQVHFESTLIEDLLPQLAHLPVPVVIDHMGRVDASRGPDQHEFRTLRAHLRNDRFWIKVSGCDRCSRQEAPYADAVTLARSLVDEFGDRVLWGTDWPHPNISGAKPDDALLVDLLADIAPSVAQRHALLVDNPQRLYRFAQ
jgi:2-pyrone-4,6-dicarboxylate lactonase